jgi:hypothetical protein
LVVICYCWVSHVLFSGHYVWLQSRIKVFFIQKWIHFYGGGKKARQIHVLDVTSVCSKDWERKRLRKGSLCCSMKQTEGVSTSYLSPLHKCWFLNINHHPYALERAVFCMRVKNNTCLRATLKVFHLFIFYWVFTTWISMTVPILVVFLMLQNLLVSLNSSFTIWLTLLPWS